MRCHLLCCPCHCFEFARYPYAAHCARHTVAKRLIWVRSLKSRNRPRVKQSTIERLALSNSILQSCTGARALSVSEDIVVEKPFVSHLPLSMNDLRANEMAPPESLGLSPIARSQFRVKRNRTTKTVTEYVNRPENQHSQRHDDEQVAFPSSHFGNPTHRRDI